MKNTFCNDMLLKAMVKLFLFCQFLTSHHYFCYMSIEYCLEQFLSQKKTTTSQPIFTGRVRMPQGCSASMGRLFILLISKSSGDPDTHLIVHRIRNFESIIEPPEVFNREFWNGNPVTQITKSQFCNCYHGDLIFLW